MEKRSKSFIFSIIVFIIGCATLATGAVFFVLDMIKKPAVEDANFLVEIGEWVKEGEDSVIWNFTEVGKGKLTTKNGDVFEGQFKNGKIEGEGIARYADGSKFKGTFKNGKRNGAAIEEDKDGKRFEGTYKDDVRDGKFVEKDRNGKVIASGTYERGHRQLDK